MPDFKDQLNKSFEELVEKYEHELDKIKNDYEETEKEIESTLIQELKKEKIEDKKSTPQKGRWKIKRACKRLYICIYKKIKQRKKKN